jgi:carboxyl-terminal processing protease
VVSFSSLPPTIAALHGERLTTAAGCVGVIRFTMWLVPLTPAFDRAVDEARDCAGMVVDLRGNPGGVAGMVMGTAGHFLADTLALGFMKTRTTQLRFKANPRRVRSDGSRTEPFSGRLAILTDEMTASTSEFFAEGLQGVGRARVFGTRSAGQALPAMMVRLPTGDVLMYAVANFTGPDGSRIEGRGVVPDDIVEITRTDLLAGRDAPFEAALDWIAGGVAAGQHSGGIEP